MDYRTSEPYVRFKKRAERNAIISASCGVATALIAYIIIGSYGDFALEFLFDKLGLFTLENSFFSDLDVRLWVISIIRYIFSLFIPFGIYLTAMKVPLKDALPLGIGKPGYTVVGIFAGAGAAILSSYVVMALQIIFGIFGITLESPEPTMPEVESARYLYVISSTIIAAVFEEIVFRGAVLQSLRRFGDVFAIATSSFLFGLFHFNLIQMPYAIIMGMVMGFFVVRSGNIWSSILIHLLNNSVVVFFEYLGHNLPERAAAYLNTIYSIAAIVLGAIALTVMVIVNHKAFYFEAPKVYYPFSIRIWYFISSPIMVLILIIAIYLISRYMKIGVTL